MWRYVNIYTGFLNPCPVCGKYPKVYFDPTSLFIGLGTIVEIKCKPFLKKEHLSVWSGKATFERALKEAVDFWQEETKE
jgi:hypothetical protein